MKRKWVFLMAVAAFLCPGIILAQATTVFVTAECPEATNGVIPTSTDFTIDIFLDNTATGYDWTGGGFSFYFYSPDQSIENVTHRAQPDGDGSAESILYLNNWEDLFDYVNMPFDFSWDGSLPDSVNFQLAGSVGLSPDSSNREYIRFHLTTDEYGLFCIDSLDHPDPSEDYDWLFDPPFYAAFNGPYCWYIGVCVDSDGDLYGDPGHPENNCPTDNCPSDYNPGQEDADSDGSGDVCDNCTDLDGDGYGDPGYPANTCPDDNCPADYNPGQGDADSDGIGDLCDECTDTDGDGYGNPGYAANTCPDDNCPDDYNPGQEDDDGDDIGNPCDPCPNDPDNDIDNDGHCGDVDNCPDDYNPTQSDIDGDLIGDACDPCTDTDGDGYANPGYPASTCPVDNCPDDYNPGQEDDDGDDIGDLCDPCPHDPDNDIDEDGHCGDVDNCPTDYNPGQEDGDTDGFGNVCDNCPEDYNPGQEDDDTDDVGNICDNCPTVSNNDQSDIDNDEIGDACDECTDTDGDGYANPGYPASTCPVDNCPDDYNPGQEDDDGDDIGDICDACPHDPDNDIDGDGFCGDVDNCPNHYNPGQEDADEDDIGDLCDECTDLDDDGYGDPGYPANTCPLDNCPADYNPGQEDDDGDDIGDICDACPQDPDNDIDEDGYCGDVDNCPTDYNPGQENDDTDDFGNECDNCRYHFNPLQEDIDGDLVGDSCDNCVEVYNPGQEDSDGNDIGDACDYVCGDLTEDRVVNILDIVYYIYWKYKGGPAPNSTTAANVNCDGANNILDIIYLINFKYKGGPDPICCPIEKTARLNGSYRLRGAVEAVFDGRRTTIVVSSPVDLYGMELNLNVFSDNRVTLEKKTDRMTLYSMQTGSLISVGLLDMQRNDYLPAGAHALLTVDGRAEIISALGADVAAEGVQLKTDGSVDESENLPNGFYLEQNRPNPFNPQTEITFGLPVAGAVRLEIYNINGHKITTLVDNFYPSGRHQVTWDGRDDTGERVSSGIYLYRLKAGDLVKTRKMILLK